MVEEHVGLGAESRAATGRADEHGRSLPGDTSTSQSHMLPSSFNLLADQVQRPSSFAIDFESAYLAQRSFTYERASGGARSVDAITVALSRQQIHNDTQSTLAEVPAAVSTAPLATPIPPDDLTLQAGSPHHQPPSPSESRPHAAPPKWSDPHMSAPTKPDMKDSPIDHSAAPNNSTRLWPRIPPRHSKVTHKNQATQALLEGMVCSEIQCNVQGFPLLGPIPGGTQESCSLESRSSLEVDQIMTDGVDHERPNFDKLMEPRYIPKPSGITKTAPPGFRSSSEVALRCRNLVRSRPRMRKRTKLREQASSSAMSSAASPTVASTATAS